MDSGLDGSQAHSIAPKARLAAIKSTATRAGFIAPIILKVLRLPHRLLLAAPVLLLLYFYGLTGVGMLGPDEPRYAAIGREMARSGDWITPRLWGEPWFEKPALLYWLVAIGNLAGLNADLAPRLPVAIFSVGFLIFFFYWVRREFGEPAAWRATAILATSAGWLAYSHVAVTDLPLSATFATAMLFALPWVRSGGRRGLFIGGLFLGLAVLAKGLVPLVLAAPLVWVGRKRWPDLLLMGGATILIAAPWYIAVWTENGPAFTDVFFWKHHFSRFVSDEIHHGQPWWYYIPVLLGLLFPWTPALVVLRRFDWREPRRFLLVLWVVWGLLFFSLSTNKLPGYILPLLPALAVMLGIQLARKPVRYVPAACALLIALLPLAAGVLPTAILEGLSKADLADSVRWTAVGLIVAAATVISRLPRGGVFATAGLMTASIVWLIHTTYPVVDRTASARGWWLSSTRAAGTIPCLDTVHRGLRYGVYYYAGRELPACTGTRDRNHDILDRDLGESPP